MNDFVKIHDILDLIEIKRILIKAQPRGIRRAFALWWAICLKSGLFALIVGYLP